MSASASTPPRSDPCLGEQTHELAAPTAEIENRPGLAEVLDVLPLARADRVRVAPHPRFEPEVIGDRVGSRLGGDRGGGMSARRRSIRNSRSSSSASNRRRSSSEPSSRAVVDSRTAASCSRRACRPAPSSASAERRASVSRVSSTRSSSFRAAQLVGEMEERLVERPLLRGEWADVPAHQPAQDALERIDEPTPQTRTTDIGRSTATDQRASASLRASRGLTARSGGRVRASSGLSAPCSRARCSEASTEEIPADDVVFSAPAGMGALYVRLARVQSPLLPDQNRRLGRRPAPRR